MSNLPLNYDEIRKVILKNLDIRYFQLNQDGPKEVYPAEHITRLVRTISVKPEIVQALNDCLGVVSDEEKDKDKKTAGDMGTKTDDSGRAE